MNNKKFQTVVLGRDAHDEILKGASVLAEAVGSTMGPAGHVVIIDDGERAPVLTKDGVSVARSINLKNKLQSIGAELLKEVASKTNDVAGDGTTCSTILAHGLLFNGLKLIQSGRSSVHLKRGMDKACDLLKEELQNMAFPATKKEDIINIGTISANGDKEIGKLLSDALDKVGEDGIITLEPTKNIATSLEFAEGMKVDGSGLISPYFITNQEKMICELSNPIILIANKKITGLQEIVPLLEETLKQKKSLLLIVDDIEGEALHMLIANKMKGTLLCCAVKAPSFAENRINVLGDIGTLTGASVIDGTVDLKNFKLADLGTCKKVIIDKTSTTFIVGSNNSTKDKIEEKIKQIKTAIQDKTLNNEQLRQFKTRLAKLSGGIAVVKVGGSTEVETLEKRDRVEDALNATIAARKEGIVAGGGTALFYASEKLKTQLNNLTFDHEDEKEGFIVVLNSCRAPLQRIVENSGKSSAVVIDKLLEKNDVNIGYDAFKNQYVNLVENGIIDPVRVPRYAIEHSCSIVGLMLTCNAVVINEEGE